LLEERLLGSLLRAVLLIGQWWQCGGGHDGKGLR